AGRRRAVGHDRPHPRPAPVLGVLGGEDQQVAEVPGPPGGGQLRAGDAVGPRRVGQPGQGRVGPRRPGQGGPRQAQIDARPGGGGPRAVWVKVWAPISWPAASSARTSAGCSAAAVPTTKNVAGTPWRRSTSRISGVHFGSGPSSKVRATVLSGSGAERAVGPD